MLHDKVRGLLAAAIAMLGGFATNGSVAAAVPNEAAAQQGIVECTDAFVRKHNPGLTGEADRIICFEAYLSNFNTTVAERGSRKPRYWGVPRWVVHHVARADASPEAKERPQSWFTVPELQKKGIAPTDDSYKFSQAFRKAHANWYERGHLAQKYLAERLGGTAGWYTHNLANAVPQRSQFNKGPWLTLECFTGAWANKYGEVWVIAGPVLQKTGRSNWLRSDSKKKAIPVAIPTALFKIVMRRGAQQKWEALAFVYPQTHRTYRKGPYDPAVWFKSVAEIERMTGETLLPVSSGFGEDLKQYEAKKLWPVNKSDFDTGCRSQKADVL